jgi:hypothetical protein
MSLDKHNPKLAKEKKALERSIQLFIRDSVEKFEKETYVLVTNVICHYHKDQKMYSIDVDAKLGLDLEKGIH